MAYRFGEVGRIGQKRNGGVFYEEFLPELRGRRGMAVYQEMAENDDIIGAVLFSIEMLIRQASWTVQPAGNTEQDRLAAGFIEECMDDMSDTWTDTISEILSFLTYGWSAHEIVYKRRGGKSKDPRLKSQYGDGLIGWQKLPIRSQDSMYEWEYDDQDNLTAMIQMPPSHYGRIRIPADKLLFFRTKNRKGNPEGRSVLRNAYRSWYFKRRIQEIEGIGIERDLAGFPTLSAPENVDIWSTDDPIMRQYRLRAEQIVQNIRRDSMEGLVLPDGWKLELLSTGGRRQFDTSEIINRYDTRMAMTVLADFVLLGHQQVGSFALSSDKTKLFAMATGAYLDIICEVLNNKAIPDLIDLNGDHFNGITDYPELVHGDIEDANLEKLAIYIRDLSSVGALTLDEGLEDYLREAAGLPERLDSFGMPSEDLTSTQHRMEGQKDPESGGKLDEEEDAPELEDDLNDDKKTRMRKRETYGIHDS